MCSFPLKHKILKKFESPAVSFCDCVRHFVEPFFCYGFCRLPRFTIHKFTPNSRKYSPSRNWWCLVPDFELEEVLENFTSFFVRISVNFYKNTCANSLFDVQFSLILPEIYLKMNYFFYFEQ